MSQTNRALNRILLALAGLMLIAAGAATAGAGILPDAAAAWAATGSSLVDQTGSLLASAPLPGPARSWWAVAGVAALVLAAGLGIAWLASQGGGRTHRVGRETDGGRGTTVVETGLISAAVTEALAGNRLVLGTSVSAWEVKGEPGLRLRIRARQGASPRDIANTADELVQGIDALLGHPLPVLVRITSGTRTRVAVPGRAREPGSTDVPLHRIT
ncbi:hypothetical protein [Arthrobacter sp. NicSoilB8]|uniref:hypothetical protein n=1 Tax=Arthrobacter sp. NicSoilB8 TaxID=2830998 RepID=UPI001CC520BF|nr:hypothetical protein [Arthrobacter sp. NicSoilB8]BCW73092.1 hypothetical protein NicSoilB8_41360 [Arthrobacter sp. NicSoilB8]